MIISDTSVLESLRSSTSSCSLVVTIGGSEVAASSVLAESMELECSIMSESTFTLGGCNASRLSLRLINYAGTDLTEQPITVSVRQVYSGAVLLPSVSLAPSSQLCPGCTEDAVECRIFTGFIDTVKRQKNRAVILITAYDELYRMSLVKCKQYICDLLTYSASSISTLYALMSKGFNRYDALYDTDFEHQFQSNGFVGFNGMTSISLDRTLCYDNLDEDFSVRDLFAAYCELNSCFGVIAPDGTLRCIRLFREQVDEQTHQVVSVSQMSANAVVSSCVGFTAEDYLTADIGCISFPYNGSSRYLYGYTDDARKTYVSDNPITKCCTDVSALITKFNNNSGRNYIFGLLYRFRPYTADSFGEWWIECGDKLTLSTGDSSLPTLEGFVLERRLKDAGIIKAALSAKSEKYFSKNEVSYNE